MTKFIKTLSIFIVGFMAFGFTQFAHAQEAVPDLLVDININQDSSINVIETINYDFGATPHHGIYRKIPYKYKARGGTFKLRFSGFSVTDQNNQSVQFDKSTSGGDIVLKIGDPNKTITGIHTYKINYTVKRAINYFDDHDELYWNPIGTGWEVPITKASAIVRAPGAVSKVSCYTGREASTDQNCSIIGGNTQMVTFSSTKPLNAGEGLTIVAGMPVGTITKPGTVQKITDIILDNGILVLPIIVFVLMYQLWRKYGKDAKSKNPVVAQYEAPDKLSPLYMGALAHGTVENQDIAAEVVYLAQQGYLTITGMETKSMFGFKGTDYEFTKVEKSTTGLAVQTRAFYDELFPGGESTSKLSSLKVNRGFGAALMVIKSKVMTELVKDGYYRANPTTIRAMWTALGILGTVGGGFLLGAIVGALGILAAILSGIIVLIFGFIMPARTQKGADAVAEILGLQDYLTVAEKDRLKFHNAPEKNPQLFEALLPFAIALGVEQAWAAQFKDLTQAPSWYADSTGHAFNAVAFSNSMNSFTGSMQSAVGAVTTASSGGSGFSGGGVGGGGGGGGGGSW